MHTTHLIALSLAAAALVGLQPQGNREGPDLRPERHPGNGRKICGKHGRPSAALVVSDARKAAPGEKVTVKGAVLGEEPVFAENIASFTIGDPAQLLANMQEHGTWTTDSVPVEIRKDNTMTVQFVDEQGNPIKQSAKGVNGLKERDAVIITGTIDPHSTPERPVLNIESIVIEK